MTKNLDAFHSIIKSRPLTSHKKMFGGIGGWVQDTFFAIYSSSDEIFLRFSDGDREAFSSIEGTGPFMNMREYLRVPPSVLQDEKELDEWVEKSYRYALTVPPAKKKKRKKK